MSRVLSREVCVGIAALSGAAAFGGAFAIASAVAPADSEAPSLPPVAIAVIALAAVFTLVLLVTFRIRARQTAKTNARTNGRDAQPANEAPRHGDIRSATPGPNSAGFDAQAARSRVLQTEEDRQRAHDALMDEIDGLIARSLDLIAARGYAGGGSVTYPAVAFGALNQDSYKQPRDLRSAWLLGVIPNDGGGDHDDWSTSFYLDDAGNVTVDTAPNDRDFQPFGQVYAKPLVERSTRQRNIYSLTGPEANPLLLIDVLSTFVRNEGTATSLTVDKSARWREYKELVGQSFA